MEEGGGQGGRVLLEVCKEEGGVEGVLNVRLAGLADLPFVLRGGEVVRLLHQLKSVFR